jgi:hypothetical protein
VFTTTFSKSLNAQDKVVQTKFYRPSLTTTFVSPNSDRAQKVIENFLKLPAESKFDEKKVKTNILNITLPTEPENQLTVNPLEMKKIREENKSAKEAYKEECKNIILGNLNIVSKEIISIFWDRSSDGTFDFNKLLEIAKYSGDDSEAFESKASANSDNIYFNIANQLLEKGYVITYNISKVQTYDEYYDELDQIAIESARITGKSAVPVKRTEEGWRVKYQFYISKIDWTNEISTLFNDSMYIQRGDKIDPVKVSKFNNAVFQLKMIFSGKGDASSSQSNDPKYYEKMRGLVKRLSMDELMERIPSSIQEQTFFKSSKKIDDFKVRASLFRTYPTLVKLGSKEGIYVDQRFFAYELSKDKDGNVIKRKIGVLRPKVVVDNKTIASGESSTSKFQQHSGKKLYQGTLIEMKEDFGIGATLGWGLMHNTYSGFKIGLEARVPRYLKSILSTKINRHLRGLHLHANLGFAGFKNRNIDTIDSKLSEYSGQNLKYSGAVVSFNIGLFREIYIPKVPGLYFTPGFSLSISSVNVSNVTDTLNNVKPVSETTLKEISFTGVDFNVNLGMGYHINQFMSFYLRPTLVMPIQKLRYNESEGNTSTSSIYVNDSRILNGKGLNPKFPLLFDLGFRFLF